MYPINVRTLTATVLGVGTVVSGIGDVPAAHIDGRDTLATSAPVAAGCSASERSDALRAMQSGVANPNERRGGKALPREAFFRYLGAEPQPPPQSR